MTRSMNLLNLIAGARLMGRLTAVFRRDGGRSARPTARAQSGQSPPRRQRGLWANRLRVQSLRMDDMSPHLRRDIGLDR